MEDCIFCKIAEGKIPCNKIYENNNFLAFLDIKPFTEGHTLIIPKVHYRWVYDLPNFGEYWEFVKETTKIIQNSFSPLFVTFLTMGNEVPHAHVHLIPRYQNDKLTNVFAENLRSTPTSDELQRVLAKIKL